jgi:hypothetical protein
VAAAFLCTGLALNSARASSLIVPDDFPTIQEALVPWPDTILVRPGTYSETPVIDTWDFTLRGLVSPGAPPDSFPVIPGMVLASPVRGHHKAPTISIENLHFSGPVRNTFAYECCNDPGSLVFGRCEFDSGIDDAGAINGGQLEYYISGCTIRGGAYGAVYLVQPHRASLNACRIEDRITFGRPSWSEIFSMGNCHLTHSAGGSGPVGIQIRYAEMGVGIGSSTLEGYDIPLQVNSACKEVNLTNNAFIGPGRYGVDFGDFDDAAYVSHNSFSGYDVGLESEPPYSSDYFTILDNRFERCGTAGIRITGASYIEMAGDTILACGAGAILSASSPLYYEASVVAAANVILSCPGTVGISIAAKDAQITSNVVGRCGGDGIVARCSSASGRTSRIAGNTSFLNAGSGYVLTLAPESAPNQVDHNIGYGNGRYGMEVTASDSVAVGCNDWFANAAGAVQGVAPSATDLALDPYFCGLANDDVRLASDSPLGDAAGCGRIGALGVGCSAPPAQSRRFTKGRVSEGIRVAREDAVGARAQDGSATQVNGAPIAVSGAGRREFRLTEVGPNPGSGPVRIGFALARAAEIEVGVYDLLGRRVTSLASGSWPAGSHELQWSGRAPAGLYVLRYQYPGGTDKRAIVRVQ